MAIETPLKGFVGESIKRKEDDRFIRGKGNYVDDISLPGMLHMAILRSPFAHARIRSLNTNVAQALPGVVAAGTGRALAASQSRRGAPPPPAPHPRARPATTRTPRP